MSYVILLGDSTKLVLTKLAVGSNSPHSQRPWWSLAVVAVSHVAPAFHPVGGEGVGQGFHSSELTFPNPI
jgi:hypothetical protein